MRKRIIAMVLTILIMTVPSFLLIEETDGQSVPDGEHLHLWFRRSPVQDSTTLSFYEPKLTTNQMGDPRYRQVIGPKGNSSSELLSFFPTDRQSNFLQFEYNESLTGNYSFTMSSIMPKNASDLEFKLKVLIEMDSERNGEYDKQFAFTVTGIADSSSREYTGEIQIPGNLLERFDPKRGGRLRITLSREDDLDTNVLLYCGYRGYHSYMNLPFSKYTYSTPEPDVNPVPIGWVLGLGSAFIFLVVFIVIILTRNQDKDPGSDHSGKEISKGKKR